MSPPDEIQTPPGPPDAIGKPPEGDYTPPRSELETEGSDQQTKWLTGARLRWVGTAFALADLMLAIDSTILGTPYLHSYFLLSISTTSVRYPVRDQY